MKRSDIPVIDVLRAHRDYKAEMDAALAERGGRVWSIMEPGFPQIARPYERLMNAGFPYKVVMARIMQLVDKRLLEYGTSPHGCWLEPAGRDLLSQLEAADG